MDVSSRSTQGASAHVVDKVRESGLRQRFRFSTDSWRRAPGRTTLSYLLGREYFWNLFSPKLAGVMFDSEEYLESRMFPPLNKIVLRLVGNDLHE
jgi:hypothetical protein